MSHPNVTDSAGGETLDLGIVTVRLLAVAEQTGGSFALAEFSGGEGPWTVPHVHQRTEESFFVLDGAYSFTLGAEEIQAGSGSFVLVPRGMSHVLRAAPGGGRLLTLWVPAGLEAMFVELSRMPPGSLRDPEVRKAISTRFDSIPG